MNKVIITITDPRPVAQLINEARERLEPMCVEDLEIRAEPVDRLTREQVRARVPFVRLDV